VASTLQRSSSGSSRSPSDALATVAEIAALLAASEPHNDALPTVLRLVAQAVPAEGVTLWLHSPRGLVRSAATENDTTTDADVQALLDHRETTPGPDASRRPLVVARLVSSGLRLGVHPLGGASVAFWAAIAERYGLDLTIVDDTVDPTFRHVPADWDGKILAAVPPVTRAY